MNKETLNDDCIECPHCGYLIGDCWELEKDDGETDCPECDKAILYSRNISVSYTAKAKESK